MNDGSRGGSRLAVFVLGMFLLFAGPLRAQTLPFLAGDDRQHRVARGETLYTIGLHYDLAIEHLAWANRLPVALAVNSGKTLLIPGRRILPANPPSDGLVLNLAERGLYLFRHGKFVHFYPVAIGRVGWYTPQGHFKLISRVKNPTWLPPAWAGMGEVAVAPGPSNPLGDRWMGLSRRGVGIHATTSPLSIGQAASHGCIRMYPKSAHALFDDVTVGMPVRIEYETASLGRDEKGHLYLSAVPDVYGFESPLHAARRLLKAAGLHVDDAEVRKIAGHPTGTPQLLHQGYPPQE